MSGSELLCFSSGSYNLPTTHCPWTHYTLFEVEDWTLKAMPEWTPLPLPWEATCFSVPCLEKLRSPIWFPPGLHFKLEMPSLLPVTSSLFAGDFPPLVLFAQASGVIFETEYPLPPRKCPPPSYESVSQGAWEVVVWISAAQGSTGRVGSSQG